MRARIIFRGLTLFTFERPSCGANGETDAGKLTAYLVNDTKHGSHASQGAGGVGVHTHTPRMGIIGRDIDDQSRSRVEQGLPIPRSLELQLHGKRAPDSGVVLHESFLRYVPCLTDLRSADRTTLVPRYVASTVVIPHGRIRARDFVTWDRMGNAPAELEYMDSNCAGFASNEVVVDVGDDADDGAPDSPEFLQIDSKDDPSLRRLRPIALKGEHADEVDPNTVEVLITNFAPQLERAVFWSLHYQWLFQAMSFPTHKYDTSPQFQDFVAAATAYDAAAWTRDVKTVGILDQPFPFIRTAQEFRGITCSGTSSGVGGAELETHGRQGDVPAHDPWNRPICPFGRL